MPSRPALIPLGARPPGRSAHPGISGPRSLANAPLDMQATACISSRVTDLFDALAAPVRRAILDELRDKDGQALYELCARLTMKRGLALTRQAISQHLEVLEAVGLVRARREGRYKFHYLDTSPLRQIAERWGRSDAEETS
jgi:DNA-binding transcriptional ArsR family regulator